MTAARFVASVPSFDDFARRAAAEDLAERGSRAALGDRAAALGYHLSPQQLQTVFEQFKVLADKTTDRPLVGMIFKFVAHHVLPITRERDQTWFAVLQRIDPKSMVVIAPEGRMKRANGLDLHGKPMTVRGGIADIMMAVKEGRMLLAYSGGLHHVQVPGKFPRIFKTVRMRVENLDLADYIAERMREGGPDNFKKAVMKDLDRRRDEHAPEEGKLQKTA